MGERVTPPPGGGRRHRDINLRDALEERYSPMPFHHHGPGAARRPRRPEAGSTAASSMPCGSSSSTPERPSRVRRIVGDVIGKFHRMATSPSMTPWCASPRISPSAIRWSMGKAISAISTAINAAAYRYTEARMTEVARLLLDGIDEERSTSARPITRRTRTGRPARRLPEPAGQRLPGHRGRHGHLDPAAQCGRGLRCRAPPHRQSRLHHARPIAHVPGPTSRRRHHHRGPRLHRGGLRDWARRLPHPRPLAPGGHGTRHLSRRRHRDSPMASQGPADRRRSPSSSTEKKLRSSPTCATRAPKTSASSSSRSRAMSTRPC